MNKNVYYQLIGVLLDDKAFLEFVFFHRSIIKVFVCARQLNTILQD